MTHDEALEHAEEIANAEGLDMVVYLDPFDENAETPETAYGYCPAMAFHLFGWLSDRHITNRIHSPIETE